MAACRDISDMYRNNPREGSKQDDKMMDEGRGNAYHDDLDTSSTGWKILVLYGHILADPLQVQLSPLCICGRKSIEIAFNDDAHDRAKTDVR